MPAPLLMTAYAGLPETDQERVAGALEEVLRRKRRRMGLVGRLVGFSWMALIPLILQLVQMFLAMREGTVDAAWGLAGADIDPEVRAVAEEQFNGA
jgi:hypothetical protein